MSGKARAELPTKPRRQPAFAGPEQPARRHDLPRLAYRVREVVAMTGLSKSSVHDLVRRGQLEAVRLGAGRRRTVLIPATALDALFGRK